MQHRTKLDYLLAESFKELVVKTPIEKITIKEITDLAGVIRPTFYNHFQDKYELLEWIIRTELVEPMEPLIQKGLFNEALLLLFNTALDMKEFCIHAAKMEGQNSFESIVNNCIKEILCTGISSLIKERNFQHAWITPELIAEYYAQSMTFVIMKWIRSGMIVSPEEMAEIYEYIVSRSLKEIINRIN